LDAKKKKNMKISRERADGYLKGLVYRAQLINATTEFVDGISRLAVFGSYMTDKAILGDLDIAVELGPRGSARKFDQKFNERCCHAPARYSGVDSV
jgi:hypothetical protein